ncbi:hypothetical protein [Glutamicibacter sp. NPDC087344]|uniref:hypothetical protein n=1 Tax=Glutamicibacter sp. NPDC087344 TaxID=3363994 RepID=UPI0037FDD741
MLRRARNGKNTTTDLKLVVVFLGAARRTARVGGRTLVLPDDWEPQRRRSSIGRRRH